VDALQLFDSHGGHLPAEDFYAASGRWLKEIIVRLKPENAYPKPPVIVFSLGAHGNWNELAGLGASVLGVDHQVSLAEVRRKLPADIGVQGNLDPSWLLATPPEVVAQTQRILAEMRGAPGHIFNLGHGVPPAAKLENISAVVETVRAWKSVKL
jgi:uroporphyrinogen decarboxylase